jgi:hypothetical protein
MKIINLLTGVIFDLPSDKADALLSDSPKLFALIDDNENIIKNETHADTDSVLSKILDK